MTVSRRAGRHWGFGPKRVAGVPMLIAVHGDADSHDDVAAVGPTGAARTGRI